jgi:hypothetical protein
MDASARMTNMCASVVLVLLRLLLLQGTLIIAFGICQSTGQRRAFDVGVTLRSSLRRSACIPLL